MNALYKATFFFIISLYFLTTQSEHGTHGNASNKTHFVDIPPFKATSPERISLLNLNDSLNKWIINLTPFISYSKNNAILGEYFLPGGRNNLYVSGDLDYFDPNTDKIMRRDIDSSAFGITDSKFQSVIRITPESQMYGVGCLGQYIFNFNNNNTPRWSLQIASPIYNKKHTLRIKESIKNYSDNFLQTNSIQSMKEALSNKHIKYNRWNFDNDGMNKTNIGDIEFNILLNILASARCSTEAYLGIIIPTQGLHEEKKNKAHIIFEPTIGNGGHVGLQYGTNVTIMNSENSERTLKFIISTNSTYLFANKQYRSFDLKDRPWSRYLPTYLNFKPYNATIGGTPVNTTVEPLVNTLTLQSTISPNFSITSTAEIMYTKDWYNLSAGYSFYAQQSESVMIEDDYQTITLKSGNPSALDNVINPNRTINMRFVNEDLTITTSDRSRSQYFTAIIKSSDIDKTSATHPGILTGSVFGKISFVLNEENNATVGLGGSYRFSHTNTAIEYATGWLNFMISF
jgi:hypothetical protein